MNQKRQDAEDRERVLAFASEKFFYQGYRNTTAEEILEVAGVSAARFLELYESMDELCRDYLRWRNEHDAHLISSCLQQYPDPLSRFFGLIRCVGSWLGKHSFRGCAFLNIVAELPAGSTLAGQEGVEHYERLRAQVVHLTEELVTLDPVKYGHLDVHKIADEYMIIVTGVISLATLYQNDDAIEPALRAVEQLLLRKD